LEGKGVLPGFSKARQNPGPDGNAAVGKIQQHRTRDGDHRETASIVGLISLQAAGIYPKRE
jgi:hypothetical protein